jgi:hypothetical protein
VRASEVYICMINDMLLTQNTSIFSTSTEAAGTDAALSVYPLATSTEPDNSEFITMRAFCATLLGKEASVTDPVQCRGFCKAIPKICSGTGVHYLKRFCRISNYQG